MKKFDFVQAQEFLFDHIPPSDTYKYPGELGLRRQKALLVLLGEPQNKLKVIHVAGTSGKGSTCYLISKILTNQGFKIGLSLSPHLTDIRERFQINGQLVSEDKFCQTLAKIVPAVEKVEKLGMGKPTYFEILIALAFHLFALEKVNYAVIETGLGGWLDGTNVVDRKDKLAVISKIGHDHVKLLGRTLDKIALHKAKIIRSGNLALSIHQHPQAAKVIATEARKLGSHLEFIEPIRNYCLRSLNEQYTVFDFRYRKVNLLNVQLGLLGRHQMENASLALTAVFSLSRRDKFNIDQPSLRKSLKEARFPGRLDIIGFRGKTLIVDGAHNVQKMSAFLKSLVRIFPSQKFVFVLAFKKDKNVAKMLSLIAPLAANLIITTFFNQKVKQGYAALAMQKDQVDSAAKHLGLNYHFVCKSSMALNLAIRQYSGPIVVTGSLYLVGELYEWLNS